MRPGGRHLHMLPGLQSYLPTRLWGTFLSYLPTRPGREAVQGRDGQITRVNKTLSASEPKDMHKRQAP